MLLHIFRHVQANQAVHIVKQITRQLLDQLRLAHAGGADKDKGHGPLLGGNAHPVAADGAGHSVYRLVLTDDVGFQAVAQPLDLLILLRLDFGRGNLRPQLDDPRQIFHGHGGLWQLFQLLNLRRQLHQLAANQRQALIVLILRVLVEHPQLQLVIVPLLFQLGQLGDFLALQIHVGTGFVQQVDGLIRQKPVGDVALGKHDALVGDFRRNLHPVELGIGLGNALHNLACFRDGGLRHGDGLETALQSRVLFNIFAVLGEGRRADDLNLAPGQGGLQDVGGVHAALRVARAHQIVNLVNDQNDVAALLDLADQALHAAFKLPAELGAGHQRGEVKQEYLLVPELIGDIPRRDPLGKSLGNGGLANAGFADETGIVLLTAVENLDDTLGLHIPADDLIQLALPGAAGQIHTIAVQEFMPFGLFLLLRLPLFLSGRTGLGRGGIAEKLVQQRERGGLAVNFIVVRAVAVVLLAEHAAHFVAEHIQVFLGNAHLLHRLVDLGNSQTPGAFQAVAFIHGNAVFNLGNKHHGDIFLTFAAHFWLHNAHSFSVQYSISGLKKGKQIMNDDALRQTFQSLPTSNCSIPSSYHRWVMYSPPAGTVGPAAVRLPEARISPISSGRIFPSAA